MMYESYETFLQTALREYYERSGSKNRTRFIALLIVSGEAVPMAVDAIKGLVTPGRLAAGALGALALRIGLRWAFTGPLGVVFTGITLASLVTYYFAHQQEIWDEVGHTRRVVDKSRQDYRSIQDRFATGTFSAEDRNLMIDGLLQRFLRVLDAPQTNAVDVTEHE